MQGKLTITFEPAEGPPFTFECLNVEKIDIAQHNHLFRRSRTADPEKFWFVSKGQTTTLTAHATRAVESTEPYDLEESVDAGAKDPGAKP